jgi:hypothetical protein
MLQRTELLFSHIHILGDKRLEANEQYNDLEWLDFDDKAKNGHISCVSPEAFHRYNNRVEPARLQNFCFQALTSPYYSVVTTPRLNISFDRIDIFIKKAHLAPKQ